MAESDFRRWPTSYSQDCNSNTINGESITQYNVCHMELLLWAACFYPLPNSFGAPLRRQFSLPGVSANLRLGLQSSSLLSAPLPKGHFRPGSHSDFPDPIRTDRARPPSGPPTSRRASSCAGTKFDTCRYERAIQRTCHPALRIASNPAMVLFRLPKFRLQSQNHKIRKLPVKHSVKPRLPDTRRPCNGG